MDSSRIFLAAAGLFGAAGVALAAIAAHVAGGSVLATAAQFLILHAASAIGLLAVAERWRRSQRWILVDVGLMLLGVALFSGDLALRQLTGVKFLWGTAPFGGSIMIVAWLGVAVIAVLARHPSD